MHLYLDTADRAAAEPLLATGLFAGLTTNPTILQRSEKGVADIEDIHRWARAAGAREIFFQVWGEDTATLVERGLRLSELGPDVVVKLVVSKAGAAACAELSSRGIPTLLTAVYHPGQAMVAAAAGATYIAPYLGRLADAGRDAVGDVAAMQELFTATGSATKVLLASIRDVDSMVTLARAGVSHFTMAPAVAEAFFTDKLTAAAAQAFEDAVVATTR
ncbi:transaldolase [Microlunatus sagamiharensis]|uniref:Transaldolase n=1 Tax=Microlunatus sagamiharensis TaxID=546874 RepID=A0A1H2MHE9_9ACTN|nr:transaldolase family protein [Microlunatus sagamiharensis]SDU92514.1 transaldolase [Microlunatus sagamiharensis]